MASDDQKPVIFLAFANDWDDRAGYLCNLPGEAQWVQNVIQR